MPVSFNPFTGNLDLVNSATTPGGSTTQIQFNDGGAFGGDADLTFNKDTNVLTNKGDINLDDGGTYTTTVQCVTPTANRTISFPDATGTAALVAGSSGQITYNSAGAQAGDANLLWNATTGLALGKPLSVNIAGAADTPSVSFLGSWFTGGTSTTTKPKLLIEPSGTTSTGWSTAGTGLGINAASGFAGNLLDLQVNGTRQFRISQAGEVFGGGNSSILLGVDVTITNPNSTRPVNIVGYLNATSSIGIGQTTGQTLNTADLILHRDAANTLAQRNSTNAQTFRCYGTYTDASNYVRASLSSTDSAVTLAAETAGTGADNIPVNITAAGTGTVKVNSVAEVAVSSTVANLPATPAVGMLTRVTDATAPAVGSTVAGGGSAAALVWYNGTNWTVIGV